MNPLTFLQICLAPGWGGQEMFPLALARELTRQGHAAPILARTGSRLAKAALEADLRVFTLSTWNYFDPLAVRALRRMLLRLRAEPAGLAAIHVHRSKDLWHVVPALRGMPIPLIYTNHMGGAPVKRDFLHRRLHRRVDSFLSVSPHTVEDMVRNWDLLARKVRFLPPGVDTERFHPILGARERVREEFGVPLERKVAILVGQIDPRKGQREFVEAILMLADRGVDVEGWVVGRAIAEHTAFDAELKAFAAAHPRGDRVRFTGFRADVPELLNAADVAVAASWNEAFGMTPLEAWAVGRPVLAARAGSFTGLVREGLDGSFYEVRSAEDLAVKLVDMFADRILCDRMGSAGQVRVVEEFSMHRIAERHIGLYESLAGRDD